MTSTPATTTPTSPPLNSTHKTEITTTSRSRSICRRSTKMVSTKKNKMTSAAVTFAAGAAATAVAVTSGTTGSTSFFVDGFSSTPSRPAGLKKRSSSTTQTTGKKRPYIGWTPFPLSSSSSSSSTATTATSTSTSTSTSLRSSMATTSSSKSSNATTISSDATVDIDMDFDMDFDPNDLLPTTTTTSSSKSATTLQIMDGQDNDTIDKNKLFLQDKVKWVMRDARVEVLSTGLVLISSFLAALSTVSWIDLKTYANMLRIEHFITYVFAVEFVLRWYSQFELSTKSTIQYLTKPLVLVDLAVVIVPLVSLLVPESHDGSGVGGNAAIFIEDYLPSFLFSSSSLINLRLLRLLRIQRVLADMDSFLEFQKALGIIDTSTDETEGDDTGTTTATQVKPYELQLARVMLSIFTLVSVSTGLIYSVEHEANPAIPDYFTALYFVTTTISTVGFGDIYPVTQEGKLVVSLSIMAGVAVIPALAATFVEASVSFFNDANDSKNNKRPDRTLNYDTVDQNEKETKTMTMANSDGASSSQDKPNAYQSGRRGTSPSPTPPPLPFKSKQDQDFVATHSCPDCGAQFHWTSARFCWNCGSGLHHEKL